MRRTSHSTFPDVLPIVRFIFYSQTLYYGWTSYFIELFFVFTYLLKFFEKATAYAFNMCYVIKTTSVTPFLWPFTLEMHACAKPAIKFSLSFVKGETHVFDVTGRTLADWFCKHLMDILKQAFSWVSLHFSGGIKVKCIA